MATRHRIFDVHEVRKRAAGIRRRWSPLEKLQRTGLPPDMPPRLREFFFGSRAHAWCTASDAPGRKTESR